MQPNSYVKQQVLCKLALSAMPTALSKFIYGLQMRLCFPFKHFGATWISVLLKLRHFKK
jgi:hypothetical protein